MLKWGQSKSNNKESKRIIDEFIRISRKYLDIFNRLWYNNDWIKKYNLNKRDASKARSPSKSIKFSETHK